MTFSAEALADYLLAARQVSPRSVLTSLPDELRPATLADGVKAQLVLAERLGEAMPAGFKIGATAQRMQAYLGLEGPIVGFMPTKGLRPSEAVVPYAGFLRPGVECELAVRLAHDLPAGSDALAAAEAVDELFAAIEIVEQRYADIAHFGTPALVADQVFHAGAVLGSAFHGWRAVDLHGIEGTISVDRINRDGGFGRDLLGGPIEALTWLAGSPAVLAFGGLKAGQVVMLGSVTPPVWLDCPAQVSVRFPPFAEVHVTFV